MEQDRIQKVLLYIFYALTLGAVVSYFAVDDKLYFYYLGGGAICVRLIHYFMRFMI